MKSRLTYYFLLGVILLTGISKGQSTIPFKKDFQDFIKSATIIKSNHIQIHKIPQDLKDKVFSISLSYTTSPCKAEISSINISNAQFPLKWYKLSENGKLENPLINPGPDDLIDHTTYLIEDKSFRTDTVYINKNRGANIEIIYPNPSKHAVNIQFSTYSEDHVQLKIFDHLGKILFANTYKITPAKSNIKILPTNLSTGIYYLYTRTSCSEETRKLVYFNIE